VPVVLIHGFPGSTHLHDWLSRTSPGGLACPVTVMPG